MPKADDLYTNAKGVALDGVHLFRIGDKPVAPATLANSVRLYMRESFVRCTDGTAAVRRLQQDKTLLVQEGVGPRDLPSQYGYVTDAGGAVTHWFAPSGLLFSLTYLGRSGDEAATQPHRMPD
ncbi:MAG: hypothetical protein K0Q43_19 [Ramlibacter sp.]|jgi:hypothetical protein|nr:hypothetical protein [Ramlibacter sp.]